MVVTGSDLADFGLFCPILEIQGNNNRTSFLIGGALAVAR
jgi:hypothetical protein